jgi:hypothetical protein
MRRDPVVKKVVLALLLPLAGCTMPSTQVHKKHGQPQWALSGFLHKTEARFIGSEKRELHTQEANSGRVPADSSSMCLRDRLTLQELQSSIRRREGQRGGTPPQAVFQGIDLTRLPAPQGNLVRFANGIWLPTDASIDYSGCSDIPCALNRIWGVADDSLEGYLAYWWYLDMGYVLGATKLIPQLNLASDTQNTYRDYLFRRHELELFWRLTKVLPDTYRNLSGLQTMHRLAPGIMPASWSAATCGDAWGGRSSGFIRLQDNCLSLSSRETLQQPRFTDFGYIGVTHELTHRLDASRAGADRSQDYLSEQWALGFAPLSGWRLDQVVSPSTGGIVSQWRSGWRKVSAASASGVSAETWVEDNSLDGFVRDYAGTSPAEDFADSAAYFRLNPVHTLRRSPRKYQWISEQFYGGRKFDPDSRQTYYQATTREAVRSSLASMTEQCISSPAAGIAQASSDVPESARSILLTIDIPGGRAADSKACLEARIHQEVTRKFNDLRASEFEACDDLSADVEPVIRREIMAWAQNELPALIAQQAALAPIVAAQTQLRARLLRGLDPREAYLACRTSEAASECYLQSVRGAFARLTTEFQAVLGIEGIEREWEVYIGQWSFDAARARLREVWERFVANLDMETAGVAVTQWQNCSAQYYSTTEVHPLLSREGAEALIAELLIPYSGGTEYVDLRLLECLNSQARTSLQELLAQKLQAVGIRSISEAAQLYLEQEFVLPVWIATLDGKLAELRVESRLQNSRGVTALAQSLSQILIARGTAWVRAVSSPTDLQGACPSELETALGSLQASVAALDVRVARWPQLKATAFSQACELAVRDTRIQSLIAENVARERSARRDEWTQLTRDLRARIRTAGETLARSCVSQNPGSRTSPRIQARRRECVRAAWSSAVVQPSKEAWLATDAVRRLSFATTEVESWLRTNDASLQTEIIDYLGRI